jgi:hypothetical protein
VYENVILKLEFKENFVREYIGFMWLRIATRRGQL